MDRFILDGEHAVIDRETNLMWVRTDSMNDLEKWVNYQESVDYVSNFCEKKIAGFNDWRLPTREEMSTLYNESYSLKDKFEKDIHISSCFSSGGGFSMIAQQVSGRMRTFVKKKLLDSMIGGYLFEKKWIRCTMNPIPLKINLRKTFISVTVFLLEVDFL